MQSSATFDFRYNNNKLQVVLDNIGYDTAYLQQALRCKKGMCWKLMWSQSSCWPVRIIDQKLMIYSQDMPETDPTNEQSTELIYGSIVYLVSGFTLVH